MKYAKEAVSFGKENNVYTVVTNANKIRISFMTDEIVRIRSSFSGDFSNKLFALIKTSEEDYFDEYLKDEREHVSNIDTVSSEIGNTYTIKSKKLILKIEKKPFRILIYDRHRHLLHADVVDLAYMEDNNNRHTHADELFKGDCFFGLGEKSGELNRLRHFYTMNAGDAFGYDPVNTDGLYKHIPFYIRLNSVSHIASGYLYNTSSECDFDFGRRYSNYWEHRVTFRNNNGDVDFFFIAGPEVKDIVKRFTDLTGKPLLLPKYSLGYLGSSMIYAELPAACDTAILNFVKKAEKEQIPLDGFQLSSGYTMRGLKRCVFTWNRIRFPNPKKFIEEMDKHGIVVSPNVKPGILKVHPYYKEMAEQKIFIKDDEGNTDVGKWWGGEGSFVDLTDENARNIWKKYMKENLLDYGIRSIWNDNCEYDGNFNDDANCSAGKISELRPVMANIMCKLTIEAIKESYPNERPFVVCRAGHTGIQRYAQTWSGDNYTSWDSLKYNIATMLNAGLSGLSNYGSDVGGFAGPAPEPELFVRWVQCGIFEQRFSIHSVNDDISITEPWMYKEHTGRIREAIQFRYRLIPYYYSLMYSSSQYGTAFMSPMLSIFQNDEKTYSDGESMMLGDYLMACPVVDKGQIIKEIYLPKDNCFYDFWTHRKYDGGETIKLSVNLDSIPLFLREGAIIPMAGNQLMNIRKDKITDLNIIVVPGKEKSTFRYYDDDGISYDYENGQYHLEAITVTGEENILIENRMEGDFTPGVKTITYEVLCEKHGEVKLNGSVLSKVSEPEHLKDNCYMYSEEKKAVLVKIAQPSSSYCISIF